MATTESVTVITADDRAEYFPANVEPVERRQLFQQTRLFPTWASLAMMAVIAAVVTKRPEILALAAPFLLAVGAALVFARKPDVEVSVLLGSGRVIEGESVHLRVDLTSVSGVDRIEVELDTNAGFTPATSARSLAVIAAGTTKSLHFELHAAEWGIAKVEHVRVRAVDRFGLFSRRFDVSTDVAVHVGMAQERIEAPMEAERFRRIVGSHLSPDRGQGVEIADIRPWQPGDTHKDINWRITNRRGEPWITLRHPDRSTNLIVVVDAHEGDDELQRSTQRKSVTAAMAVARAHLARHDRVGLLIVGHTVHWLAPQLGRNHLFSMADALVTVGSAPEASLRLYRPVAVNTIASDTIVLAISPLFDPRMANLLAELRSRGNPVSVLVPEVGRGTETKLVGRRIDEEARQLAAIEHQAIRRLLTDRGVALMDWPDALPVGVIVESLQRLRRSMRRARTA